MADQLVVRLGGSRPTSPEHTPSSTRPPSPTREHRHPLSRHESPRQNPHDPHHSDDSRPADPDALSDALLRASFNAHRHAELTHSPLSPTTSRAALSRGQSTPAFASRNSSSASLAELGEDQHPRASVELDLSRSRSGHRDHHHHERRSHSKRRSRSHHRHHAGTSASHISLPSLLHDVLHANIDVPKPVGVIESQRYMDLEDYLRNPSAPSFAATSSAS